MAEPSRPLFLLVVAPVVLLAERLRGLAVFAVLVRGVFGALFAVLGILGILGIFGAR